MALGVTTFFRLVFAVGKGLIQGLPEITETQDPIELFGEWYDLACRSQLLFPDAVTLATSTAEGKPSARMVLLKSFDERGFVFFTNYGSRKASELKENPHAALVFYWGPLQRQVRVEGQVELLEHDDSEAYFRTRPRGSQIGAWTSRQSAVLRERQDLERQFAHYQREFAGRDVELPEFWGGFRVAPERIEFWQGKANRLHDRIHFTRTPDGWTVVRLYP
ncbi:MAG: pyridoxamine 5'-phosphate oxidase [Gammaproteobacteria bacterium]|nr:pyridoxamine 5'-phosphate oxidase [Gammaproteobacteria bacterium]